MLKDGIVLKDYVISPDRVYKRYKKLRIGNKVYRILPFQNLIYREGNGLRYGHKILCKNSYFDNFFVYNDNVYAIDRTRKVFKFNKCFVFSRLLNFFKTYKEIFYAICLTNIIRNTSYSTTFPYTHLISDVKGITVSRRGWGLTASEYDEDAVYSFKYNDKTYSSDTITDNEIEDLLKDLYSVKIKTFKEYKKEADLW